MKQFRNQHVLSYLMGQFQFLPKLTGITVLLFLSAISIAGTSDTNKSLYNEALSSSIREQHPILIPQCQSPREALDSFFAITRGIKDVFSQSSEHGDINWDQEQVLIKLYSQLRYLMDDTELPERGHFARVNINSSQLSEILDRIPVPVSSKIPDLALSNQKNMDFWRIPNTEIALARIKDGSRQGDWVFSSDTIKNINRFHDLTKGMPYRENANVGIIKNKNGLVDHYISFTGPLISVNFTDHLPAWMRVKVYNIFLWKYFSTFLLICLLVAITWCLLRLTRFPSDQQRVTHCVFTNFRRMILPVCLIILLPIVIHFITIDIRLRMLPLEVTDDILWGAFYLCAFWGAICFGNFVAVLIIRSPLDTPHSLVRLTCRFLSSLIGLWIIFEGLKTLGVSLVPLIAGVSVGGLAFALAAKSTLSNIIGGVLIFADKPFAIGERVLIGKHEGVVEEIGFRSTRIRTLDGHLVTVPNEEVCACDIVNISRRPHIKRKFYVGLTYDTSPEKIKEAIDIINQLLSLDEDQGKSEDELGHPGNVCIHSKDFPPRVFFEDLAADSLNLLVVYWFAPPDKWKYHAHASWVNTELVDRFNCAGLSFAFPTQTIEMKTDQLNKELLTSE